MNAFLNLKAFMSIHGIFLVSYETLSAFAVVFCPGQMGHYEFGHTIYINKEQMANLR